MLAYPKPTASSAAIQISLLSESNSFELDGTDPLEDRHFASLLESSFGLLLLRLCGEIGEINRAHVAPVDWDDALLPGKTLTTFITRFTAVFSVDVFPTLDAAETRKLIDQLKSEFHAILDDVFDEENVIEWLGIEVISGEAVEKLKALV